MEIAIRYFTKSKKGNTEKLANVVSKALNIEALDVSKDLEEKADKLRLNDRLIFFPSFPLRYIESSFRLLP